MHHWGALFWTDMFKILPSIGAGVILVVAVLHLFLHGARAQDRPLAIGPEDVLTITIYAGGEEEHQSDVTVSAEGVINAPFIGSLQAAGLTPSQLEEKITRPLAEDYFVDPKVHVRIKEFHGIGYYIYGSVNSPGLYRMGAQASLLDLIAEAGGIADSAGNVAYIMKGAENHASEGDAVEDAASKSEPLQVEIDLGKLLEKGDQTQNPILTAGDVVYIPHRQALDLSASTVFVEGFVKNPGLYNYQPGLTALNVCTLAGGFAEWANPKRAKIIRKGDDGVQTIKINLVKVREGKIPDVKLKPGDRVYIPEDTLF
jgi:polysaccharide export outer membrane protein